MTEVAAPAAELRMSGRTNGTRSHWVRAGSWAPNDVRTTPGWRALAVTVVP